MELLPIGLLRPPRELSLWDVPSLMGEILRKGYVDECISVNEDMEVTGGLELYWALYKLGVRLAPVGFNGCYASLDDLGFYDDVKGNPIRVYSDSLDLALRGIPTPLVKLRSYSNERVRVWAKLEWFNPFSLSIKDKPLLHILREMSRRGGLEGRVLADASSANFGIALAALAPQFKARARVYLPRRAELFGRIIPRVMGAEVVETEAELTVELLSRILEDSRREGLLHVNQFLNDLNFESHLRITAKELDYQARMASLKLVAIAGSLGTSGHMVAVNFYFRYRYGDKFKTIMAQPARGEHIPGMRRSETGMIWLAMIAEGYELHDVTLGEALEALRRVARVDGLLIGPSGGAALVALEKSMGVNDLNGDVVVIIPDTGFKYVNLISKLVGG
jgi:cysteine synthase/O-phosphoserine sulfhydrylase/cystathionine beta-synthase